MSLYFIIEESEAQKSEVIPPGSHSEYESATIKVEELSDSKACSFQTSFLLGAEKCTDIDPALKNLPDWCSVTTKRGRRGKEA